MRVLVTGGGGQLAECLRTAAGDREVVFDCLSHEQFDLLDKDGMAARLDSRTYDWCLNTAAYTAVDQAEEEPEQAMAVNRQGVGNLAELLKPRGIRLVHFSTDFVFDGGSNVPLKETDPTYPISAYGRSKLEGEELLRKAWPESLIVRTSWLYSEHGSNFVKTILRLVRERDTLNVVYDQLGSPTYGLDLAQAALMLCEAGASGVYHYCNEGVASWFDLAVAIAELVGSDCRVSPIESHQYPTAAKRPQYSVLSCDRIRETLNLDIPHWRVSLAACLKTLDR